MTKYELINRMIIDLDHLTVQGVGNMSIILHTIDNLKVLGDGLKKEDEQAGEKPKLEVINNEQGSAD